MLLTGIPTTVEKTRKRLLKSRKWLGWMLGAKKSRAKSPAFFFA